MKARGFYDVRLFDPKGRLIQRSRGENMVVTAGLYAITHRLAGDGSPPAAPSHISFGDSALAPAMNQTSLDNESGILPRAALTAVRGGNAIAYINGFIGSGVSNETVAEMGIFNAASGGTMYARFLPQLFVFEVGMVLGLSWTISIE